MKELYTVTKAFKGAGGKLHQPGDVVELTEDQAGKITGYVEPATASPFDGGLYQQRIRAMLESFRQTKPKGWQAITKNKPDTWRQHLAACRKADQAYQNKDGQGVIDALAEAESSFNQLIQPL